MKWDMMLGNTGAKGWKREEREDGVHSLDISLLWKKRYFKWRTKSNLDQKKLNFKFVLKKTGKDR